MNLHKISDTVKYSIAWHGTPHDFDSFNLQAIGTGEGAQVHGWGLYFAGDRKVSEEYRERLSHIARREYVGTINGRRLEGKEFNPGIFDWTLFSPSGRKMKLGIFSPKATALNELVKTEGNIEKAIKNLKNYATDEPIKFLKKNKINLPVKKLGSLFKVDIPDADVLLDEDKSYRRQKKSVQNSLREAFESLTDEQKKKFLAFEYDNEGNISEDYNVGYESFDEFKTYVRSGRDIYHKFAKALGSEKAASERLNKYGVKGITYEGGRDDCVRNFV